ncbi:hypothetical protein [Vineibacter terrae]|uniref:hypothetical protein n=1 Tax=Vineibacter terrae TaxID=2586908 RepID=UPI002E35E3D4|nr:hypothetical protein [Vineibacter terrae]HEX2892064.1 hypothetical protein [Vineibacter terrae]
MKYDDYVAAAQAAAALFEKGDLAQALARFESLAASDISAIDKARMLNNVAIVLDRLGRAPEALRAYDRAIALEWPLSRGESIERKAVFLADKGDAAAALVLYEDLMTRSYATEDDKHRYQERIAALKQR